MVPLAAAALVAAPTAAGLPITLNAAELVPLCALAGGNLLANGDFEQGAEAWRLWGSPAAALASPGAAGSQQALATARTLEWSYASQTRPAADGRCMALEFDARLADAAASGGTVVTARGPTWPATLSVEFVAGKVTFRVGSASWVYDAPQDGAWHHYRLEAHELGVRLLAIDGFFSLATAPIELEPVDWVYVGDPGALGSGFSSAAWFDNLELRRSPV